MESAQSPAASPSLVNNWIVENVDLTALGNYSSIAINSSNWPRISYYDEINKHLKFAYKDSSGWHLQTVDSSGYVGAFTSLALDSAGWPHISYCSCVDAGCTTCDNLKYARYDGLAWNVESPDTAGNVGGYTSLALISDLPYISYYDFSNGDLKFTYKDNGGIWHSQTLDNTGDVGLYTSLAVGFGERHISYMDNTHKWLKYAHYNGSIWEFVTLDNTADTGYYSSIALCRSYSPGGPRIAYWANGVLKFASRPIFGTLWSFAELSSDPPAGISLALDSSCQRRISYYEMYQGHLKYIFEGITGSLTETVDDKGDVAPIRSSLALDSRGQPHISYVGLYSPFGLRYAHRPSLTYLPVIKKNALP
jgi:hypothetical protein